MTDKLIIGGHEFTSRFILGSGKYSPELIKAAVSEASGFLSLSYFTKIFTEKEGCSPSRWRKARILDC